MEPAALLMKKKQVITEDYQQTWRISGFSGIQKVFIEKPFNLFMNNESMTWMVKLFTRGMKDTNKDYVFCGLTRCYGPMGRTLSSIVEVETTLSAMAEDGTNVDWKLHSVHSTFEKWFYIKRTELTASLQPSDTLTINLEISTKSVSDPVELEALHDEETWAKNFKELYRTATLTDFIIRVGKKNFHCHRSVLAARSPVFMALLNDNTNEETKNGIMRIPDIEADVMETLLNFMYSGRSSPEESEKKTVDVLEASDKYHIHRLKQFCEEALIQKMTRENASVYLVMGDKRQAINMKEHATDLILHNYSYVLQTPNWTKLAYDRPDLAADILTRIISHRLLN